MYNRRCKDIIDTGTYSLKIEGRMKRPEYVAGVVDNYRKAVDKVILKRNIMSMKGKNSYYNYLIEADLLMLT